MLLLANCATPLLLQLAATPVSFFPYTYFPCTRIARESGYGTFDRPPYDVSIFFKGQQPQLSRATHSIPRHLHVLYENSIVYGRICMYYHISIFQKTAISILDSVPRLYRLFTTPLRKWSKRNRARVLHHGQNILRTPLFLRPNFQ